MKECPNCKTMLEDDELFCHECGTKQEIEKSTVQDESSSSSGKKCSQCGELIEENCDFCPYCGKKQIKEEVKTVEETKNNTEKEKQEQTSESVSQEQSADIPIEESGEEKQEKIEVNASNNQEDEKPTENTTEKKEAKNDVKSRKTWAYATALITICCIGIFGYYYIKNIYQETNHETKVLLNDYGKRTNSHEKTLDFETFLTLYKSINPYPYYFFLQIPSEGFLNYYNLICFEYQDLFTHEYVVGRNFVLNDKILEQKDGLGWCFVIHKGVKEDFLVLKILDKKYFKDFVKQARAFGLVEIKMYNGDDEYVENMPFAAQYPFSNSSIIITSKDEVNKYGVIGPFVIREQDNSIILSANNLHWNFSR